MCHDSENVIECIWMPKATSRTEETSFTPHFNRTCRAVVKDSRTMLQHHSKKKQAATPVSLRAYLEGTVDQRLVEIDDNALPAGVLGPQFGQQVLDAAAAHGGKRPSAAA